MSVILDKLLKGQKVEWLPLGQALKRTKGTSITAGQMKELHKKNAPVKIFAGGRTFAMVNYEDIPKKDINNEPSIIVKSRGIIEFEYFDKPFSHKNEMWAYNSQNKDISTKFVYYYLKTKELYFQQIGSKMQMPQIATPDTDKFLIPIPSLDVQAKIVKILDAFTALTAELTAELTMREKQYHYYRDKLLTFSNDEVEWKTLGEVANISSGGTPSKTNDSYWLNGDIPWLKSEVCKNCIVDESKTFITNLGLKNSSAKFLKVGTVLMAMVGATIFKTAYLTFEATTNQNIAAIKSKSNLVLDKYIFYFLINSYDELTSKLEGYNMINLSQIKLIKIPIPSLKEQKRIIAILDKFEMLTNSITEGLPKEIALRQQQYEYYREQLLDFPK